MSEATVLDIDQQKVYVALLDEGTDVWRPVDAIALGKSMFVLIRPMDYDAEDEKWEFLPGSIVRCEERERKGESFLVAVEIVYL